MSATELHDGLDALTDGERILLLRKRIYGSQGDLADELGVTRQTISSWETDRTIPDALQAIALAAALNTTVEGLFRSVVGLKTTKRPRTVAGAKRHRTAC